MNCCEGFVKTVSETITPDHAEEVTLTAFFRTPCFSAFMMPRVYGFFDVMANARIKPARAVRLE